MRNPKDINQIINIFSYAFFIGLTFTKLHVFKINKALSVFGSMLSLGNLPQNLKYKIFKSHISYVQNHISINDTSSDDMKTFIVCVFLYIVNFSKTSFQQVIIGTSSTSASGPNPNNLTGYAVWAGNTSKRKIIAKIKRNCCISVFFSWCLLQWIFPISDHKLPLLRCNF